MTGTEVLLHVRELPATPDVVFRCLTDPAHLAAFWGPEGSTTPLDGIVVELRVGGRFETEMVGSDGGRYRMRARYDEIDPPHRLRWTDVDTGMVTTTTLTASAGGTWMEIRQADAPPAVHTPGAIAGFRSSLDRFHAYLEHRPPAARETRRA
jgi:uncharacterized protein YndB with AHSA1/START domain